MNNLNQIIEEEAEIFEVFRRRYEMQKPPPSQPGVSSLGWQFWVAVPAALAAIIMAALRTANIFYDAASLSGLGETFSIVEAAVAMVAVEGGLVAYSAIRANSKAESNDISAIMSHDTRLIWAIFLMVLVSVFAGLGQSVYVVENISIVVKSFLQYSLFLVTGIGASFIAWIGGEVLGSQVAVAGMRGHGLNSAYAESMEKYMNGLRSSWARSDERKIVRGEMIMPTHNETFGNFRKNTLDIPDGLPIWENDWRKMRPFLTAGHISWMIKQRDDDLANLFNVTERTIANWRENIREEF